MTKGKRITLIVLEGLENQLLNSIDSESQKDILKNIKQELREVQEALQWVRTRK